MEKAVFSRLSLGGIAMEVYYYLLSYIKCDYEGLNVKNLAFVAHNEKIYHSRNNRDVQVSFI